MCRFNEGPHDYHNPNPVTNENPVTKEEIKSPKLFWLNRGQFCCKFCEHEFPERKRMMALIRQVDDTHEQVAMVIKSIISPIRLD